MFVFFFIECVYLLDETVCQTTNILKILKHRHNKMLNKPIENIHNAFMHKQKKKM